MSSEKKPQPVAYTHPLGGLCRIPLCEDPKKDGWIPLYSEATIEALRAERDEFEWELNKLREAIRIKGGNEHSPTWDAYEATCRANERNRERAETAEVRVAQLEAERNAEAKLARAETILQELVQAWSRHPHRASYHALGRWLGGSIEPVVRRARALLSDGGAK